MEETPAVPTPPSPVRHRRSLPIYVGSGGIATASHYAVAIVGVELLGVAAIVATTVGYATGALIKYWLNYSVAFRSNARHTHAILRFAVTQGVLLVLNTTIFGVLQGGLGLHYLIAQAITTVLLIPPGYVIHRAWVFR